MRGDIQKFIFLFFLVLTNMLSIVVVSLDVPQSVFLEQLLIIVGMFVIYSVIMIIVINKSMLGKILLALFFISFLLDVFYLLNYTQSNILAVICIVSVIGALMSFLDIDRKRSLSRKRKTYSKQSEIDKELNDDWNEKPKIIFE
jgi:hypothetical protein